MGIDPSIIDLHYRFAHHCEIPSIFGNSGTAVRTAERTF
jgi:hypothetical protein